MKKSLLCLILVFALILSACSSDEGQPPQTPDSAPEVSGGQNDTLTPETAGSIDNTGQQPEQGKKNSGFSMKVSASDGKLSITRAAGAGKKMGDSGVWTIFVYLCGTDLESDQGSATSDIAQMLESKGGENVRFIIQTGGTKEWYNDMFAVGKAERYIIRKGDIELVDEVELTNMGEASTLESFLKWGVANYASEKMGLVFWDHGGGSITGVCVDELFGYDTLSLSEINSALSSAFTQMTDKFEFIGFDCCLMGTAEVANILATYARYMYGSQETEPGSGWDYTAISDYLASNRTADGAALGKVVADSFYEECRQSGQEDECTMTVVDLSRLDDFLVEFNDYASRLYEACQSSDVLASVVRSIEKADNFGGNNRSEGYTNMVDIGGIVNVCSDYVKPGNVLSALKNCISYNKNGSNHKNASGLSIYYPLQIQGSSELKTFSGIAVSPYYMSLADMVATGYTDNGYSNEVFFTDDGEWSNEDCYFDYFEDDYFDYVDADGEYESALISFDEEPYVDEDGSYCFVLDEEGREWAVSVEGYLALNIDDVAFVELGETAEVYGDFETGVFIDGFDGFWFSLPDEQLIAAYVVDYSEDGERAVYTSPVYLNGKRTNLRFWQEGINIHVEGTWDGIDEYGMAARQVRKISEGDVIRPVYYLDDDSEFEGDEYEWKENDDLCYTYLPEGEYYYAFFIDDAFGDYYMSDYVTFRIDANGEIFFVPDDYGYGDYGYEDYGYEDYGYGDYGYGDYGYGDYGYGDYGYGFFDGYY
ncbi:MAG: hypothetical protein K6F44_01570 [Lachnospiraceae bacterium]|nr:hypothetical protein [Lachnospiraceae bacterium]